MVYLLDFFVLKHAMLMLNIIGVFLSPTGIDAGAEMHFILLLTKCVYVYHIYFHLESLCLSQVYYDKLECNKSNK